MIRAARGVAALLCLIVLSACAAPPEAIQIRSGLTSDADLDALRPPSGVTYRYTLSAEEIPVPVQLTLRSQRRNATTYDYRGTMALTLPQTENLEEVGNIVAEAFGVKELRFEGNSLLIPVSMRTDNRFRSKRSKLLFIDNSYTPHDCFAVLGTCTYRASVPGGPSLQLVSTTTEEAGVWRTETRPARGTRGRNSLGTQRMIYSLDRNGVLLDLVLSRTGQGPQGRSPIIFRRQ